MELSPCSEAYSCSAIQEIPRILWNPKGRYRGHIFLYPQSYKSNLYSPIQVFRLHFNIILQYTLGFSW
jgi:hypothetical protein